MGHFVSSPRERAKRKEEIVEEMKEDRRDSRGNGREGQGRKRNRNESKETEKKNNPPLPLLDTKIAGLVQL